MALLCKVELPVSSHRTDSEFIQNHWQKIRLSDNKCALSFVCRCESLNAAQWNSIACMWFISVSRSDPREAAVCVVLFQAYSKFLWQNAACFSTVHKVDASVG